MTLFQNLILFTNHYGNLQEMLEMASFLKYVDLYLTREWGRFYVGHSVFYHVPQSIGTSSVQRVQMNIETPFPPLPDKGSRSVSEVLCMERTYDDGMETIQTFCHVYDGNDRPPHYVLVRIYLEELRLFVRVCRWRCVNVGSWNLIKAPYLRKTLIRPYFSCVWELKVSRLCRKTEDHKKVRFLAFLSLF
jgi:hypothetical protein